MDKALNPRFFIDKTRELNEQAQEEIVSLLKSQGERRFIMHRCFPLVSATVRCPEACPILIWGVGLDEDGDICIRAYVDEEKCTNYTEDFPEDWVKVNPFYLDIDPGMFPCLYCFVAKHLDKARTKEEADMYEKAYSFLYEDSPNYLTSRWGYHSDTSDYPDDEDEPLDLIESSYLFDKDVDCADLLADSMFQAKQVKNDEQFIILSALLSSAYKVGRDDKQWQIEHGGEIVFAGSPQDALANYAITRN